MLGCLVPCGERRLAPMPSWHSHSSLSAASQALVALDVHPLQLYVAPLRWFVREVPRRFLRDALVNAARTFALSDELVATWLPAATYANVDDNCRVTEQDFQ